VKLSKNQIKRLFLGGVFLALLLYGFSSLVLRPLKQREATALAQIQELQPRLAAANKQISETQSAEAEAPKSRQLLDQIKSRIPDGEPIAWFPPRIVEFFKRHGIEKVTVRLNNEFPEKDLAGFKKISWSIDLPNVEFIPLAIAISALENEDPLLEITNLQVEANGEREEYQQAQLTVSTLVKQ
jgi:hypothetical protein